MEARLTNVLFVKQLPCSLSNTEKEELLKYFGADEVRVMPDRGKFKHSAFATFKDAEKAKETISRLHQIEILNSVISVEFAHSSLKNTAEIVDNKSEKKKEPLLENTKEKAEMKALGKKHSEILPPIAPHFGLQYPANPGLKYKYPPPNSDILINICSALITVPKLYTQVLHLMNKMNLVPPFTSATAVPQMLLNHIQPLCIGKLSSDPSKSNTNLLGNDTRNTSEMSESESEIETDESEGDRIQKSANALVPERVLNARKRKKGQVPDVISKRRRLQEFITPIVTNEQTQEKQTSDITAVFGENIAISFGKKIEVKVPSAIISHDNISSQAKSEDLSYQNTAEHRQTSNESDAVFGKFTPVKFSNDNRGENDNEENEVLSDFITLKLLEAGQLSKKEMSNSSLFKKYSKGDPTCRLYVKNLSKRVTEKDLKFIYGLFVNFKNETEKNMFDVRVMTQGRMKGQAFVGLPSVEIASKALKATNGYQLMNKPMIVQFARSAKPK